MAHMMQNLMGNNTSKVPESPPWGNFLGDKIQNGGQKISKLSIIVERLVFPASDSLPEYIFLHICSTDTVMCHVSIVVCMPKGQKVTESRSTGVIFSYFQNLIILHLILKETENYTQINSLQLNVTYLYRDIGHQK